MTYSAPEPATRRDLVVAVTDGDTATITAALLGVINSDPDWKWLQDTCLSLLTHVDTDVRSLAAIGLGHVARIHGTIEQDRVKPALRGLALREPALAGRVEDALDDIAAFACE